MRYTARWARCACVVAREVLVVSSLCVLGAGSLAVQAQEVAAAKGDPLLDRQLVVDIGPQDLASAVIQLSKLADVQLVVRGGHLNDIPTPGLHGKFSLRVALGKLLEGTGYSFHKAGVDIIGIDPPPGESADASPSSGAAVTLVEGEDSPAQTIAVTSIGQKAGETSSSGDDESAGGVARLDDVVVTSTKRPQKLRDIPQSITALSGDDLEKRGVENLQDIVKMVPGVNMSYDTIPARVTIRGISQSANTSPTTGAIFGNVSFTDAYLPIAALDANPFDLESVEVLKGPQGTLFGSSNLNGAIRYVPKAPELGSWGGKYYGQYTSIEGAWAPSYGAVVNMPLFGQDDMALRVAAFQRNSPGYVDATRLNLKDTNEVDQTGARAMLAWKPGNWDLGFTYAYQDTQTASLGATTSTEGQLYNDEVLKLSPQAQSYNLADLSLAYNFGWSKLTSETSVLRKSGSNDLDITYNLLSQAPYQFHTQFSEERSRTICEELRLSSPEDQSLDWHWMIGALGWKEDIHINVEDDIGLLSVLPFPLPSLPGGVLSPDGVYLVKAVTDASAREYALFGEVTHRFSQRVELTLGGRYYRTLSGGSNVVTGIAALTQGVINPLSPLKYTLSGEIPESGYNPKASLAVHLADNVMTYATVSRGYRVGGVQYGVSLLPQPQNPVPAVFKSDTIWNYEAGVRTDWFDRTLRLDFSGYLENWKDPQYYTPDASGNSYYLTNVGGVRTRGVEGSIQYITPWGIQLGTSFSYSNTVTTEVFKAPGGKDAPPGTPWPYSPKWQTASTINYVTIVGDWNLNAGASYSYMGQAIFNLSDPSPVYGFRQLDLNFGAGNPSFSWLPELNVSVNNVLNERGIGAQNYYGTSGVRTVTYIQPRTLNLRLVGHF